MNGQLQFLYASYGRARLKDSKGTLLAAHSVDDRDYGNSAVVGWNPEGGEMWFHASEGKMIGDRFPTQEAEHFIICWNTATNEEKRYRITGAQIADAIAKVPWRQW